MSFSFIACCNTKKKKKTPQNQHQLNLIEQDGLFFDKSVKIITEFNRIHFSETQAGNCKYYCPICFRYYDCMLNSTCCQNYVCHICALSSMKNKLYTCPFCRNAHFKYVDVDPSIQLKQYSDSQKRLP